MRYAAASLEGSPTRATEDLDIVSGKGAAMTVIAMTREMGTLGKEVASGLADVLGIEVVHQELVEHDLAERLHMSESTVHRFLEANPSLWERWQIDSKRMSIYTAEEILELASRGNVLIRGWGAAQLLSGVAHVMCVRICAPMSKRIAVMQQRLGINDEGTVRREIERNDDAHGRAIERQFGLDWQNPEQYDIVLNTEFVPAKTCISLIQQLAKNPKYEETEESRRVLADKLIQAEVRKLLDGLAPDTRFGTEIDVNVSAGKVILSGVVSSSQELRKTMKTINDLKGVTEIENHVFAVPARADI